MKMTVSASAQSLVGRWPSSASMDAWNCLVELSEWFRAALGYPGISLLALTPEIAIESTSLPGNFHRDPSDQIIVATARLRQCPLVTSDDKITNYPHVRTLL